MRPFWFPLVPTKTNSGSHASGRPVRSNVRQNSLGVQPRTHCLFSNICMHQWTPSEPPPFLSPGRPDRQAPAFFKPLAQCATPPQTKTSPSRPASGIPLRKETGGLGSTGARFTGQTESGLTRGADYEPLNAPLHEVSMALKHRVIKHI